jgi:peroxisomal 3,2-trans-enoyl-CoA isomerase
MASSIPLLETIQITLSPTGVAELAFNRPNKYNALNAQTYSVEWKIKIK